MSNDEFELHNIVITVVGDPASFVCDHDPATSLSVIGENIEIVGGKQFSIYALASLLPLIPAKQRKTHPNDWMTTDQLIACPDPYCGAKFKIDRKGTTIFRHSEVTKVSLKGDENAS